eukprot:TRINITY_DN9267_c0_g1_i1.p1 TRINITY_DN9267_c0_g1~~TRINITY_DN9267_c0_g1_i1.p1  ORF type:complete len:241 (-),score=33.08 TRINITY_DN9267_c0_g1_i1:209-931(-)
MIRRPPRSTLSSSSAASDVYKRQVLQMSLRATAGLRSRDQSWKKWHGAEEWKNWIDWDSGFKSVSDEMNRRRHYFYEIDLKGRLHRLEFDQPGKRFGEVSATGADWRLVDYFLSHVQPNRTGLYSSEYSYLSSRMHEKYFVKSAISPIVFKDLRDGELRYAATLREPFDPHSLARTKCGCLLHQVHTKSAKLMGLVESHTAQPLMEQLEVIAVDPVERIVLHWDGKPIEIPEFNFSVDLC